MLEKIGRVGSDFFFLHFLVKKCTIIIKYIWTRHRNSHKMLPSLPFDVSKKICRMTNIVDPDQTPPIEAVGSGSTRFA